jgi:hypothetical protein
VSINNPEIVTVERIMNSANLQYLKLWNTGIISSNIFAISISTLALKTERNIFEQGKHQTIHYSNPRNNKKIYFVLQPTTCAFLIEILAKLAVKIKSSYTLLDQHRETQQTLLPNCIG